MLTVWRAVDCLTLASFHPVDQMTVFCRHVLSHCGTTYSTSSMGRRYSCLFSTSFPCKVNSETYKAEIFSPVVSCNDSSVLEMLTDRHTDTHTRDAPTHAYLHAGIHYTHTHMFLSLSVSLSLSLPLSHSPSPSLSILSLTPLSPLSLSLSLSTSLVTEQLTCSDILQSDSSRECALIS